MSPSTGRVLIVPNHPTGLADGVALFQALASGGRICASSSTATRSGSCRASPTCSFPSSGSRAGAAMPAAAMSFARPPRPFATRRRWSCFRPAGSPISGRAARATLAGDRDQPRQAPSRGDPAAAHQGPELGPVPCPVEAQRRAARHHPVPRAAQQARLPVRADLRPGARCVGAGARSRHGHPRAADYVQNVLPGGRRMRRRRIAAWLGSRLDDRLTAGGLAGLRQRARLGDRQNRGGST